MNYRVLVPFLARPIYRLTAGRVGSWDAAMLGLVVVSSLFTAATAILLLRIGLQLTQNYHAALLASLLFLLNFSVANLRLVGLVDAGEGFFLLALMWALIGRRLAWIPLICCGGALAKETFVVFAAVFGFAWWIFARKEKSSRAEAIWLTSGVALALATMSWVHWAVDGIFEWPWQFGVALSGISPFLTQFHSFRYLQHFLFVSILDVSLLYSFGWLVPLACFAIQQLPARWKFATLLTVASAFFLNSYYGGGPGTVGRALFSIAAPLLTLSAALYLAQLEKRAVSLDHRA